MAPSPQRWDAGIFERDPDREFKKGNVVCRSSIFATGSLGDIAVRRYDVRPIPEKLSLLQTIISARPKFIWTSAGRL
jgi:hypothetical protein